MFVSSGLASQEVDLNRLTFTFKTRVTMPAIVGHFEGQSATRTGSNFFNVVVHVVLTTQYAQLTGVG
jgi:hypothetical protein